MVTRSADERQSELFCEETRRTQPPVRVPRRREGRRTTGQAGRADAPAGPAASGADAGLADLAARATPSEIDGLVAALPDEGLAPLALASVRALRRRLSRAGAGGTRGRKGRPGALERAARQLAAELGGAAPGDDV
jgi:hypothetical protein